MMSKTRIFIPSNFTVDNDKLKGLKIKLSSIIPLSNIQDRTYHVFLHNMTGYVDLANNEVYIEDSLPVFLDKLDTLLGLQEENLL
jgi:hypothetical protein